MGLLIILTYFIIGFVVCLCVYDYYCKDFNNINKNQQFKLTWNEYSNREGPGLSAATAMFLWPLLLIIILCYFIFRYPIDCIKKHNGIK